MPDDVDDGAYEYTSFFGPPPELDEYIKKVLGLSTSPAEALDDDDWSYLLKPPEPIAITSPNCFDGLPQMYG